MQEMALTKRPLAFPLNEIKTPVNLVARALDRNAPLGYARRLTHELLDATLHVSDTPTNDVGRDWCDEIIAVLASHAKQQLTVGVMPLLRRPEHSAETAGAFTRSVIKPSHTVNDFAVTSVARAMADVSHHLCR